MIALLDTHVLLWWFEKPTRLTPAQRRTLHKASDGSTIGQISTSGTIAQIVTNAASGAITAGPDGNMWFTGAYQFFNSGNLGRVTTAGVVTLYSLPFGPSGITTGPDGNLWMTEPSGLAMISP